MMHVFCGVDELRKYDVRMCQNTAARVGQISLLRIRHHYACYGYADPHAFLTQRIIQGYSIP